MVIYLLIIDICVYAQRRLKLRFKITFRKLFFQASILLVICSSISYRVWLVFLGWFTRVCINIFFDVLKFSIGPIVDQMYGFLSIDISYNTPDTTMSYKFHQYHSDMSCGAPFIDIYRCHRTIINSDKDTSYVYLSLSLRVQVWAAHGLWF